jgi:initiation factor 1A
MVKNQTGGSKTKGQARKSFCPSSKAFARTRLAIEEDECYAQVVACLGNNMLHVMCFDGIKRLCFIRGAFRGRSRRDNNAKNGSWVLVGLRSYETGDTKMGKCDLLEVYSDTDKDKLKDTNPAMFSKFVQYENTMYGGGEEKDDGITFTNDVEEDYMKLMDNDGGGGKKCIGEAEDEEEIDEEICIDDI